MANIDIYDEDGNCLGTADRDEAHRKGYLHRNSYVIPCNDRGEVLLGLRKGKAAYSGMWAPPAEHPGPGETSLEAAVRALKEEFSIEASPSDLIKLIELRVKLIDTIDFKDNEKQTYFGYRWNGNPEELKLRENKEARLWPAYQVGSPPLVVPVSNENLRIILRELKKNNLLKRRHLKSGKSGGFFGIYFSLF